MIKLWKYVEDDVKVAAGEGSYTDPDQAVEFVEILRNCARKVVMKF